MSNPYKVTEQVIAELRQRYKKTLKSIFPQGVPPEIQKRIEREEAALMTTPNTYGLLVVDEVIKTLRRHNFVARVDGDWFSSYIAWLLDLTVDNPIDVRLIRDDCVSSPIEIALFPEYGKSLCQELIEMFAHKYDFWISKCPKQKDCIMLINECYRADDIYAKCAPIIKMVDR